jgi:cytochrome P450
MAVFTQKIIKAGIFLSLLPEWLGSFVVRRFFSVEREMDLIMNHLTPELQRIRNGESGDEVTFAAMTLNLPKEDGTLRTVAESAHLFNNVALASIHTTSHFTAFAFHELACRPELVQDLRNEVATLGQDRTPETVAKLPLMDSFFREVLRYDSDHLGMHHLAMHDTVLSTGHVIPKGSLVVGAIRQAHTDPRFAPIDEDSGLPITGDVSLDEFDAYRYAKSGLKATTASGGHLTFGLGAHACPGRYFASNEIKYVVAEMIMRYDVRTQTGERAKDNILLGMTSFPPREPLIFEAL